MSTSISLARTEEGGLFEELLFGVSSGIVKEDESDVMEALVDVEIVFSMGGGGVGSLLLSDAAEEAAREASAAVGGKGGKITSAGSS